MSYVIQAVYEDGVLKPLERLELGEHQQVQIVVESESLPLVVPITTLDPDPFELIRDIPVVVQPTDDGFLATFFDANIGMTGDTREEAVANLRLLLADVFDELEKEEARLGPPLVRQLAVLRGFMKRRA
ncbi:MAG: antitoxin family protein [Planctomycetes bacterium]|nr:antitoxin family protein [Planctomycetota bacterium]MBU4399334.1 antitoxin family protein [Planctomycetota bacterium]MCG2683751.1 antitoxin family protein [Planctomycetales bacterium]